MLRLIGWLIKASVFAAAVLIVANYFKVGKKTVSDQIKTQLSHAENAEVVTDVKGWAQNLTHQHKSGALKKAKKENRAIARAKVRIAPETVPTPETEEISSTERQKLRNLMRELNSSRNSD